MPEWTVYNTERGLGKADFGDRDGSGCSIQESSVAIEDCIWLGSNEVRMHLSREQVLELLPLLTYFVLNGELPRY